MVGSEAFSGSPAPLRKPNGSAWQPRLLTPCPECVPLANLANASGVFLTEKE